jgi:hypothetical protein
LADHHERSRGSVRLPGRRSLLLVVVAIPVITFALGVAWSHVLLGFIAVDTLTNYVLLGALLAVAVVAVLVGCQIWMNHRDLSRVDGTLGRQINEVTNALSRLAMSSGLLAEYVADDDTGASYKRAAAEIRAAQEGIIFVDLWEPFRGYQRVANESVEENTFSARKDFYAAIIANLKENMASGTKFHRRVVQVPYDLFGSRIPFEQDPPFLKYLRELVDIREEHPTGCDLRLAQARIRMHFILIDSRIVILPILSHDRVTSRQVRHGALFFVDNSGALQAALNRMYEEILKAESRDLRRADLPPLPSEPNR